jgi:hypothetical protein
MTRVLPASAALLSLAISSCGSIGEQSFFYHTVTGILSFYKTALLDTHFLMNPNQCIDSSSFIFEPQLGNKIIPRICFKPAYAYFRKVQEESKIPRIIFYEKNI